jgi:hypothetical protein
MRGQIAETEKRKRKEKKSARRNEKGQYIALTVCTTGAAT